MIGKKCYQVISGADSPAEYCPCRQSLRTKKVESLDRYEERFGKYFSIKSSPIFDENGEIIKFVDLRCDITERKQAEEQLERSFIDLAETVSRAMRSRDPYTAVHERRVAELARLIGEKMELDENRLMGLYIGGLLHDIGKISTPETILR